MHRELYIVKGVPRAPGDAASVEVGLTTLSLMDENAISLNAADGWEPAIAAFEGVWAQSPTADGRALVGGGDQNVTETMRLTIAADNHAGLYTHVAALRRIADDARRFHTDFDQYQPVYLKWWAICGTGFQYALIYDMDIQYDMPDVHGQPVLDATLVIEREPFWRWEVAPGESPTRWTAYAKNLDFGERDAALTSLIAGDAARNVAYGSAVVNRHAWTQSTNPRTPLVRNYVDVGAADVPGDAPALVTVALRYTNMPSNAPPFLPFRVFVSRVAKERTIGRRDVPQQLQRFAILNAADGGIIAGTGTASAADTGASERYFDNARHRIEVSFGAVASGYRFGWGPAQQFDLSRLRGKYQAFMRMRQTGGAAGDITVRVDIGFGAGFILQQGITVTPDVSFTTGNTGFWRLKYIGTYTFPVQGKTGVNVNGLGQASYTDNQIALFVHAARPSGSALLYVNDLVLIPFDEPMIELIPNDQLLEVDRHLIYDSTGYLGRGGEPGTVQTRDSTTANADINFYPEIRGNHLTLAPNHDNRLYLFTASRSSTGAAAGMPLSAVDTEVEMRVNIVPRSTGVRYG